MNRREMLVGFGGLTATLLASGRLADAQGAGQPAVQQNMGPMDQSAYRPTYKPAKPNATPSMTNLERDAFEKKLKCQCTCSLDVYTCRTTDFTCPVSPAMHADVMRLVEGGYAADEILAAFVETYGERAMTSPKKEGFNWAGYFAPSVALLTGGVVLTMMLRRWSREAQAKQAAVAAASSGTIATAVPSASADEMARLERALKEDA